MVMDGKGILCINRTAYTHQSSSDYFNMVALQDVIKDFFPAATLSECIEVFQNVLNVTVYKANWWEVLFGNKIAQILFLTTFFFPQFTQSLMLTEQYANFVLPKLFSSK